MAEERFGKGLDELGYGAFAITPGASAFPIVARAVYVGGAGNVTLTTAAGETVEFVGVAAGTILPVRATHVTAASTATSMVGIY